MFVHLKAHTHTLGHSTRPFHTGSTRITAHLRIPFHTDSTRITAHLRIPFCSKTGIPTHVHKYINNRHTHIHTCIHPQPEHAPPSNVSIQTHPPTSQILRMLASVGRTKYTAGTSGTLCLREFTNLSHIHFTDIHSITHHHHIFTCYSDM